MAAETTSYEAWFRARVQEVLIDERTAVLQDQVMQAVQALIDTKRQVQSTS